MITFFEQHPVDLVIDCVGGNLMGQCFEKLNRYGRWIMIATMGGAETTINLETVWRKRIRRRRRIIRFSSMNSAQRGASLILRI